MRLKMMTVGPVFTNCFVVWCSETKEAIVIDPGFVNQKEAHEVLDFLKRCSLKVKFIVDTHGHPDHTSGNGVLKSETKAPLLIHELDAPMLSRPGSGLMQMFGYTVASPAADGFLHDGEDVRFGEVGLRVLHTPGHTPGGVSLEGEQCVFTGDTLFAGSVGRVDLPGGSGQTLMRSLKERLAVLPDDYAVYPGHGPVSTMGREKRGNPFLRDFDVRLLG